MSCNGCRVLRKGCSESCILRPCLQFIERAEAQGHATVFVAKFFGRAGLMSFISAVPENQRPALFRSLLFDAVGRTVDPVNGAVGLLWTGNWHVCQAAVETVLRGGALKPIPEFLNGGGTPSEPDDASECTDILESRDAGLSSPSPAKKRRRFPDLDLTLTPAFASKKSNPFAVKRRLESPSMNSEESQTTTCRNEPSDTEIKLLNLFN